MGLVLGVSAQVTPLVLGTPKLPRAPEAGLVLACLGL